MLSEDEKLPGDICTCSSSYEKERDRGCNGGKKKNILVMNSFILMGTIELHIIRRLGWNPKPILGEICEKSLNIKCLHWTESTTLFLVVKIITRLGNYALC